MKTQRAIFFLNRPAAFTLVELLIAISIFGIVLAAITTVFYTSLRLRNSTSAKLEAQRPTQRALNILKHDLSNLVAPGGTLSGTLQSSGTRNIMGQVSPDFYTSVGTLDDLYPWGDVQKVSYLLLDSTNGALGKDLVRAVSRDLLATTPALPTQERLMEGVQNLAFSYYDGTQWQQAWDSTTQTNLPQAIKVEVQTASANNSPINPNVLELVIPLSTQTRTNS